MLSVDRLLAQQNGDELGEARERARGFVEDFTDALPRLGVAVAIVVVAWLLSRMVRAILRPRLSRARTPSFGNVISKLVGYSIVTLGVVAAVTVAFPSIQPVDVVAGLGVVSIAAGFAFQDIFSNLLSGLLLIVRQPFRGGDEIKVLDHEGIVEGITIRETQIRTFDGRRILIPNRDVYQNAIEIQTAFSAVRTNIVVGCSYDDDLEVAATTALAALAGTAGVLERPAPEAYFVEFGESSVDLDLRYWTDPHEAEIRQIQHRVVLAIKAAFDDAGLDIPFPIRSLTATGSFWDRGVAER